MNIIESFGINAFKCIMEKIFQEENICLFKVRLLYMCLSEYCVCRHKHCMSSVLLPSWLFLKDTYTVWFCTQAEKVKHSCIFVSAVVLFKINFINWNLDLAFSLPFIWVTIFIVSELWWPNWHPKWLLSQ